MKVPELCKIIVKEFKKDILISILLFALIDFIYANFTGNHLDAESGSILWQGGDDVYLFGISDALLKLVNVSIALLAVAKITDKLCSDIMAYILARVTDCRKFMRAYIVVVLLLGTTLLIISHVTFYCFAGFSLEWLAPNLLYLVADALGFLGIMVLYVILNNCLLVENSFLYVLAAYVLNMILPIPVSPAISTIRFLDLREQIGAVPIMLLVAAMDLRGLTALGSPCSSRRFADSCVWTAGRLS